MTSGKNRVDALEMIDDAKKLWLETALAKGCPSPNRKLRRFNLSHSPSQIHRFQNVL
jgi:predicted RNase H-like HicB family nuclease